jgi:hypothetical protein
MVIIFDEPRRAPRLRDIADEQGVFRDGFSSEDWPFDKDRPELCILSFGGEHFTHVALAEAGRQSGGTLKRAVTFDPIVACPPLPLAELAQNLDFPLTDVCVRTSSREGRRVEGRAWAALFEQLLRLAPEMAKALIDLDALRRLTTDHIPGSAYEQYTLEMNAIGTGLDLADMNRQGVLRAAALPRMLDGELQSGLDTLDRRQQEPQARFYEPDAIDHDAQVSATWVERAGNIGVRGVANFRKGERLLRVYDVNNKRLETIMGVDLLYHNHRRNSFVLIQHKMMRHETPGSAPVYRVDDRMRKQMDRMDAYALKSGGEAPRRLTNEAFFWKICEPALRRPRSPELAKGWYFSRPWMRELVASDDARGPRDGVRITEELTREGMSHTLFAELVQGCFIGSAGAHSVVLCGIVEAEVKLGLKVIVAVEGDLAPPPK